METQECKVLIEDLSVVYSAGGKGFPILILPGWGGSSQSWRDFLDEAEDDKYRIIVLDLPGFGKSEAPKEVWSVDDYVEFVQVFTKKMLLEKFVLLGHSFGGRVSIKFSSKYPDEVERLILVAAAGIKHKKSFKQKVGNYLAFQGKKIFEIKFLKRYFNFFRKMLYKALREKDYLNTSGTMTETFKKVVAEDLTPALLKINQKTLIVWGTNDKMVPVSDAYLMKEQIKDSKLEVLESAGHGIHREMPKRLFRIVTSFLSKS